MRDTRGLNLAESREEPAPFQPEQSRHRAKLQLQGPKSWIIKGNPGRTFPLRSALGAARRERGMQPGITEHPKSLRSCPGTPPSPRSCSASSLCNSIQQLRHLFTSGMGVVPLLPFIFKLIYLYFGFLTHLHPLPGGNQNQKSPRYRLYQLNKILPQGGKSSNSSRTQICFSFPQFRSYRGGKLHFSSFFSPDHSWVCKHRARPGADRMGGRKVMGAPHPLHSSVCLWGAQPHSHGMLGGGAALVGLPGEGGVLGGSHNQAALLIRVPG